MKSLRRAIDDYIALRRSLGFKLRDMADDLRNFAAFMKQKGARHVTTELAMEWAMQPTDHQPSDWAQRLSFVHAKTGGFPRGRRPKRPNPARTFRAR
jgi:integrase/recombinase XerD